MAGAGKGAKPGSPFGSNPLTHTTAPSWLTAPSVAVHTSPDDHHVRKAVAKVVARSAAAQPKSVQSVQERLLPADYGNPSRNVVAPSDRDTIRKAQATAIPFPLKAAAKDAVAMTVGLGPAAVETGKAFVHHPIRTSKQLAEGTADSYRQLVAHPDRTFEQHPLFTVLNLLGPLAGAGRVAGTAHELSEAQQAVRLARSGHDLTEAERLTVGRHLRAGSTSRVKATAKALVHQPRPIQRQLRLPGGGVVHPRTSRNYLASLGQNFFDRRTEKRLAAAQAGERQVTLHPSLSPTAKVARTVRDTERVERRVNSAPADRLGRFEQTKGASAVRRLTGGHVDIGSLVPSKTRLSAAEQKAVHVLTSGEDAATHAEYHGRALEQGIGDGGAHEAQMFLVKNAAKHLDTPKVREAVRAVRDAIHTRERLTGYRDESGNLSDEGALRLGKHSHELRHGAAGFPEGHSLLDELHDIEETHGQPVHPRTQLEAAIGGAARAMGAPNITPERYAERQAEVNQLLRHADDVSYLAAKHADVQRAIDALGRSVRHPGSFVSHPPNLRAVSEQLHRELSETADLLEAAKAHTRHRAITAELTRLGHEAERRGAVYLPVELNSKTLRRAGSARVNPSTFGIAARTGRPEHRYTGAALRSGDFRINGAALAGRRLREAQRLDDFERVHDALWQVAPGTPEGMRHPLPIRDVKSIPTDLRRIVQNENVGHLTPQEEAELTESKLTQLKGHLFPHTIEDREVPHVRWLEEKQIRALMPRHDWGAMAKVLSPIDYANQVIRFGRFLHLGYGLWLPQNILLHLVQAGPFALRNLKDAVYNLRKLDPATYDKLAHAVGTGVSHSYVGDARIGHDAMQAVAGMWSHLVDHYPRMMSLIHEMRREGFHTADDWTRLANAPRGTETHATFLNIARRASHELIDYDSMTDAERATLKKLFTSWAWVRGASAYGIKFPLEHPAVTFAAAQDARQHEGDLSRYFGGHVPSWLDSYAPLGGHRHGTQSMLDTEALNPLAQLGSDIQGVEGLTHPRSSDAYDLRANLAPVPSAALNLVTGTNAQGNRYSDSGKSSVDGAISDLAHRFQPYADYSLVHKSNGVEEGGLHAAIHRALGDPRLTINFKQAQTAAEKDYVAGLSPEEKVTYRLNQDLRATHTLLPKLHRIVRREDPTHAIPEAEWQRFEQTVRQGLKRRAEFQTYVLEAADKAGVQVKNLSAEDRYRLTVTWAQKYLTPQLYREAVQLGKEAKTDTQFHKLATTIGHAAWHGQTLATWDGLVAKTKPARAKPNALR